VIGRLEKRSAKHAASFLRPPVKVLTPPHVLRIGLTWRKVSNFGTPILPLSKPCIAIYVFHTASLFPSWQKHQMAPHKKLQRFHQKHLEGAYDPVLRAIPLFLAVPALALVAVDLDRYERNSAFHHVQHRQYLVLDVITLSFLGLIILCYIVYLTASRSTKIPPWVIAPVDCLLSLATTILGDMAISMRTSKVACFPPLGECTGSTQGIMAATGALLIIIS
jgi:hypothetical protein